MLFASLTLFLHWLLEWEVIRIKSGLKFWSGQRYGAVTCVYTPRWPRVATSLTTPLRFFRDSPQTTRFAISFQAYRQGDTFQDKSLTGLPAGLGEGPGVEAQPPPPLALDYPASCAMSQPRGAYGGQRAFGPAVTGPPPPWPGHLDLALGLGWAYQRPAFCGYRPLVTTLSPHRQAPEAS